LYGREVGEPGGEMRGRVPQSDRTFRTLHNRERWCCVNPVRNNAAHEKPWGVGRRGEETATERESVIRQSGGGEVKGGF